MWPTLLGLLDFVSPVIGSGRVAVKQVIAGITKRMTVTRWANKWRRATTQVTVAGRWRSWSGMKSSYCKTASMTQWWTRRGRWRVGQQLTWGWSSKCRSRFGWRRNLEFFSLLLVSGLDNLSIAHQLILNKQHHCHTLNTPEESHLSADVLHVLVQTCCWMSGMMSKFSGWGWLPWTNTHTTNAVKRSSFTKYGPTSDWYKPWWACPLQRVTSWPPAWRRPPSLCLAQRRHRENWDHRPADWCNRTDRALCGLPMPENNDSKLLQASVYSE